MQLGSEYLTSNTHIAYPFADNATGLDYEGAGSYTAPPRLPVAVVVDAMITVPSDHTLYLYSIRRAATDDYVLTFRDSDGNSIPVDLLLVPSTGFVIYDLATTIGAEPDLNLVPLYGKLLVSSAEFEAYMLGIAIGQTLVFGATLPLAQRAIAVRPARMLTLKSYDRGEDVPTDGYRDLGALEGHVRLIAGYNIQLEETTLDDVLDTSGLEIAAIPGAGAGRVPCEEGSGSGAQSAQVGQQLHPDELGNVRITGDQCYAVIPHMTTGEIEIQGNCVACCDCDDFVAVGEELRELLGRTKQLYEDLTAIHLGPLPRIDQRATRRAVGLRRRGDLVERTCRTARYGLGGYRRLRLARLRGSAPLRQPYALCA
jgi:hypothetical protein